MEVTRLDIEEGFNDQDLIDSKISVQELEDANLQIVYWAVLG